MTPKLYDIIFSDILRSTKQIPSILCPRKLIPLIKIVRDWVVNSQKGEISIEQIVIPPVLVSKRTRCDNIVIFNRGLYHFSKPIVR